jgi:uncharacterized protein YggE
MLKTVRFIIAAVLLFSCSYGFAQSSAPSGRDLIITEGRAELTGQNDSARFSIGVQSQGRDLEQTAAENGRRTKAVLSALKGLRIKELKLKTANYRVMPQKDFKARPPKITGYEVFNSVEGSMEGFETNRLSNLLSKIMGTALENGANNIHHLEFYIQNRESLEREALVKATQDAMRRAKILAEAAGVTLKGIASLSTQPNAVPIRHHVLRGVEMKADASSTAPPLETGESIVRAHVSIAYEIE